MLLSPLPLGSLKPENGHAGFQDAVQETPLERESPGKGPRGPLPSTPLLLLFSHSVMSGSLRPHGQQHARPPCPSLSPGVCSNSCPSIRGCHPTISSSVGPFSSCLQSFPASGSVPVSQLFASGGQRTGASASAASLGCCRKWWGQVTRRRLSSGSQRPGWLTMEPREALNARALGGGLGRGFGPGQTIPARDPKARATVGTQRRPDRRLFAMEALPPSPLSAAFSRVR